MIFGGLDDISCQKPWATTQMFKKLHRQKDLFFFFRLCLGSADRFSLSRKPRDHTNRSECNSNSVWLEIFVDQLLVKLYRTPSRFLPLFPSWPYFICATRNVPYNIQFTVEGKLCSTASLVGQIYSLGRPNWLMRDKRRTSRQCSK